MRMFQISTELKVSLGLAVLMLILFSIPFFSFHQGLPSGDSQKAIVWAHNIIATGGWPQYGTAIEHLNRDPVDFLTPGLHMAVAVMLLVTGGSLVSIGLISLVIAVLIAIIAASIARAVWPQLPSWQVMVLTMLLLLTQLRFFRYIREPGYHFQNLVGEMFLFAAFLIALKLTRSWSRNKFYLLIGLLALLAFTHQFSTFLAAFMLLPVATILVIKYHRVINQELRIRLYTTGFVAIILVTAIGASLDLRHKIPHIFTAEPHLTLLLPSLADYPRLMGTVWLFLGLAGLVLLLKSAGNRFAKEPQLLAFGLSTLVLMLLSQGPRFGIDIPPVRVVFYMAVPFSVTGAGALLSISHKQWRLAAICLAGVAIVTSTTQAYTSLSHTVRTNSTLLPTQLELAQYLKKQPATGAVLVDDYNRRSSSWLVLSGKSMFTRIAADLARQMDEARQSDLRRQLYLNQLDYEKIFSLSSHPLAAKLMQQKNVAWVTGITGKSNSGFAENPALVNRISGDITLYARQEPASECETTKFSEADQRWLLKASTLVNVLGDDEDNYEHLPASLRAANLSSPQTDGICVWLETTAPVISFRFNVSDYVAALWDQDNSGQADSQLEAFILTDKGQEHIHLTPEQAYIKDDGFIELQLENSDRESIKLYLIALGLAKTP